MQASIFSCSTAFLAWEMLAVLLLAILSFMVLLWRQTRAQRVGHIESVNITLNPQSSIPPWRCLCPPTHIHPPSILYYNLLYVKDPFCLRESVLRQLHFIWRKSFKRGSSWTAGCHFSVSAHAWLQQKLGSIKTHTPLWSCMLHHKCFAHGHLPWIITSWIYHGNQTCNFSLICSCTITSVSVLLTFIFSTFPHQCASMQLHCI